MLQDQDRLKLDDIIKRMIAANEPDSNIKLVVDDFKQKYSRQTPVQQEEQPGYLSRVGTAYNEAGKDIVSAVQQGSTVLESGLAGQSNPLQIAGGLLRTGLRTAGEVAGAAFAPIVEAPIIKQGLEKIGSFLMSDSDVNNLVTKIGEISKKYPEASKDAEAILNIVTLGGGKTAYAPLKAETRAIGQDIVGSAKALLTPSEEAVQAKVQGLFNKSIKPTAKKTLAQAEKYQNDTLNALKTINKNVDSLNIEDATGEIISGRKPQTINELAQAVDQTKKIVFKQYDDLSKSATAKGAVVDAKPIADEILQVANNKALQITNPELIKYAEDWSKRLRSFDVLDTETTQAVIQNLNNNLQAFYRNPTYDAASKVAIDAGIANNFRVAIDKAIEGATGKEYQVLKSQYASLKAIENDVTRAAMRDARKNVKGLLDYTDIFTGGQMVTGILSLNPAMFTKGAVERGFKEYIKFLNDPNRAVKNIFEQLDKQTFSEPFNPKSTVGKIFSKSATVPTKIDRVASASIPPELQPLAKEVMKYKTAEEFVRAQVNTFHGGSKINDVQLGKSKYAKTFFVTDNADYAKLYANKGGLGKGVINDIYVSPTAKLIDIKNVDMATIDKIKKIANGTPTGKSVKITRPDGSIVEIPVSPKDRMDFGSYTANDVIDGAVRGKSHFAEHPTLVKIYKKLGYDGMVSYEDVGMRGKNIGVWNKDVVKTKSQLIDFYNKVKGKML